MANPQLFLNSGPVEDEWRALGDDEALSGAAVIISAARWRAQRDALIASGARLGLRLSSGDAPDEFAEDLNHFELIALNFPKFNDGTCYSYAHLLRRRYGFVGQLRATGQVLVDQLFLMRRCGIDAFETADPRTIAALEQAGPVDVELAYQRSADRRLTITELRQQAARAMASS